MFIGPALNREICEVQQIHNMMPVARTKQMPTVIIILLSTKHSHVSTIIVVGRNESQHFIKSQNFIMLTTVILILF